MSDATYSYGSISRLVDGLVATRDDDGAYHVFDAEPCWAEIRARIERSGDVESEVFLEVLDIENAIAALRRDHPAEALVVLGSKWGFDGDEIRGLGGWTRLKHRGIAWLSAYLSGEDPEEAWRRAGGSTKRTA